MLKNIGINTSLQIGYCNYNIKLLLKNFLIKWIYTAYKKHIYVTTYVLVYSTKYNITGKTVELYEFAKQNTLSITKYNIIGITRALVMMMKLFKNIRIFNSVKL